MTNKMVPITVRVQKELSARIKKQSKRENRSQAAFIRRVLDRYLLEQEFRGGSESSDKAVAAQDTITENKELLKLLRNS